MRRYWVWLDLPAIALLVVLGWLAWPSGILDLAFSAWTLWSALQLAVSIACYLGAVVLLVLPHALPYIEDWRLDRAYREMTGR
jgi:hypothetical protein